MEFYWGDYCESIKMILKSMQQHRKAYYMTLGGNAEY